MACADDELSTADDRERRVLNATVRTILLSTITDHVLTAEYEVLGDDTRRLSEVRLRMYTQLVTRSRHDLILQSMFNSFSDFDDNLQSTTAGTLYTTPYSDARHPRS